MTSVGDFFKAAARHPECDHIDGMWSDLDPAGYPSPAECAAQELRDLGFRCEAASSITDDASSLDKVADLFRHARDVGRSVLVFGSEEDALFVAADPEDLVALDVIGS